MGWSRFKDKSPGGSRSRSRERPPGPSQSPDGNRSVGIWGTPGHTAFTEPSPCAEDSGRRAPGSAISPRCKLRPKKVCIPG